MSLREIFFPLLIFIRYNSIGFSIAKIDPGSVEHETNNYGRLTANAVKKFQSANGINTIGILGPLIREALNRYDFSKGS